MSETKRIIVLANSIKKGGRCVAGRVIDHHGEVAEWLRPISDVDEGTLWPQHMPTEADRPLDVLDVVDVPLTRCAGHPCHPEDWYVRPGLWRHVEPPSVDHNDLEESPGGLWLEDMSHSDRVAERFLLSQSERRSLYMIRPRNLRVRLSREFNSFKNREQKKTRGVFDYAPVTSSL